MNGDSASEQSSAKTIPLRITLIYIVFGVAWILLSDRALLAVGMDVRTLTRLQTAKGVFFVLVTAGVFYALISQSVRQLVSAAAALRETQERWSKRQEAISAGIIVHNSDGRVAFVNRAASGILGLSRDDMVGRSIGEVPVKIVREDGSDFEMDAHPVAQVLRTSEPVRGVVMGICSEAGAECRWILVNAEPIMSALTGKVEEVLATFADITDMKHTEEAVRDSEKRLADIISFLPDATFVIDTQGRVIAWNHAIEEMTGVRSTEMLGRGDHEYSIPFYGERRPLLADLVIHPDSEGVERYPEVSRDGDALVAEVYVGGADMGGRYLWGKATPLYDSHMRVVGAIETVRDLTERKRVEDALRSREVLLELFMQYTPAAVAMFDKDMRYLLASRRWMTDYKLGDRDIIGLSHYEVFPEMPDRWKAVHQRVLHGAVESADEDPFPRTDGTVDWVRWELHPWYDAKGEIGGLIMFTEVITARKQAEEELRLRREREREIREEAEEAKKRFYRGTIFSVTDGKLNLVNYEEIDALVSPDAREIQLNTSRDLAPLRDAVEETARAEHMCDARVFDLSTAVGEAAANAVKHARGGAVRIGVVDGVMQVCITDEGSGMDALVLPRATLMTRFSTTTSMGLGYSLILACVDRVYLATGPRGTSVLIEKTIAEPSEEISLDSLPDVW